MRVEITKMVYQHPWYVFSALLALIGWLGGLFISPMEKVAVGDETQLSAIDRTRPIVPTVEADRWRSLLIRLSGETGRLPSDASGRRLAVLEPL